jgi:hypothetical protein
MKKMRPGLYCCDEKTCFETFEDLMEKYRHMARHENVGQEIEAEVEAKARGHKRRAEASH